MKADQVKSILGRILLLSLLIYGVFYWYLKEANYQKRLQNTSCDYDKRVDHLAKSGYVTLTFLPDGSEKWSLEYQARNGPYRTQFNRYGVTACDALDRVEHDLNVLYHGAPK